MKSLKKYLYSSAIPGDYNSKGQKEVPGIYTLKGSYLIQLGSQD